MVGLILVIVFASLISAAIIVWMVLRIKRDAANSLSPQEVAVKDAEKQYQTLEKACDKELSSAQRSLEKAQGGVNKTLGHYGGIRLFEDRVQTPQGVASFMDGPVSSTVDTAGNIAVSQRITLTRLLAGGIIGGIIFPKKNKTDSRELYLLVQTPQFASMIECKPEHANRVRQLAVQISNTSLQAESLRVARQNAIDTAEKHLGEVSESRQAALAASSKQLETARSALDVLA